MYSFGFRTSGVPNILVDPDIPAFQGLFGAPSKQVACTVGFYLLLSEETQRDVVFFRSKVGAMSSS